MKLQLPILVCLLVPGLALPAQTATERATAQVPFDARAACEAWQEIQELQRGHARLPSLIGYDTHLPLLGPEPVLHFVLSFSPLAFEAIYEEKVGRTDAESDFDPRAAYRALLDLERSARPPARPEPEIFADLYRGFHGAKGCTEFDPQAAFLALHALDLVDSMGGVIPWALPRVIVLTGDEQRADLFDRLYRFHLEHKSGAEVRTAAVAGE